MATRRSAGQGDADDWTMPLLIRAAKGKPVERVPVWLMRQAGRYLPEYHEARKDADGNTVDFFHAIRDPEMAAEITVQPVLRFGVDAAIVYSDILIVPAAMGCKVEMVPVRPGDGSKKANTMAAEAPAPLGPDGQPAPQSRGPMRPNFPNPLVTPDQLDALNFSPNIEKELGYVCRSIVRTREMLSVAGKLDVAVIGFTGGPWTLMTYMLGEMGGGGGGVFAKAKKWLYTYPEASQQLLTGIADVVAQFLIAQAKAGAHMCQVFDSWAGALSPGDFARWELPALQHVAEVFKAACPEVPLVVMAKGAHHALESLAAIKEIDVIGMDWTMAPHSVRGAQSSDALRGKTVQGNLDPAFLMAPTADVTAAVEALTAQLTLGGDGSSLNGYIGNVGNGLLTTTPVEGVAAMVAAVQKWRPSGPGGAPLQLLRIGTRASALAMVQARWVARRLRTEHPALMVELVEIKAFGDKVLDRPLHEITAGSISGDGVNSNTVGGGGAAAVDASAGATAAINTGGALFTKELEEALLAGRVDALVNCVKDMETKQPTGLTLTAIASRCVAASGSFICLSRRMLLVLNCISWPGATHAMFSSSRRATRARATQVWGNFRTALSSGRPRSDAQHC